MAKGEGRRAKRRVKCSVKGVKGVKVSGLSVKDSIANCTDSVYSSTMVVLAMAHIHSHVGVERLRSITIDYERLRAIKRALTFGCARGEGQGYTGVH